MSFLIKKRTVMIMFFATILLISAYMMFLGNFPKVVYEKKQDSSDLEKVSTSIKEIDPVSSIAKTKDGDFFIDYKLERDRLRSQEADYLRELINNPNAAEQSKEKAQQDLIALSQKVEKEMIVENLIKAKGFEDAVIFLSNDVANVVVKTKGLEAKDVAQITDIVIKTVDTPADKITIIERD